MASLIIGLFIGMASMLWLFFKLRMSWDIPARLRVHDDFAQYDKFFTRLCIGDAQVEFLQEDGTSQGHFVRLQVNHADDDQLVLAQIDDYSYRPMKDYPWMPPIRVEARMRFSSNTKPGAAGLYLWNNPTGLGAEATSYRPLKWIGFYRSPDFNITGIQSGFRASVVNGSWLSSLSMFGLKLDATEVALDDQYDWTQWHTYLIEYWKYRVVLYINGEQLLAAHTSIKGPLSAVVWLNNNHSHIHNGQFNPKYDKIDAPEWLDIDYLTIEPMTGDLP